MCVGSSASVYHVKWINYFTAGKADSLPMGVCCWGSSFSCWCLRMWSVDISGHCMLREHDLWRNPSAPHERHSHSNFWAQIKSRFCEFCVGVDLHKKSAIVSPKDDSRFCWNRNIWMENSLQKNGGSMLPARCFCWWWLAPLEAIVAGGRSRRPSRSHFSRRLCWNAAVALRAPD